MHPDVNIDESESFRRRRLIDYESLFEDYALKDKKALVSNI